MLIRKAVAADIDRIAEFGALMHAESEYRSLPFDAEKVKTLIGNYLTGFGIVLVAEKDGVIVGGIVGGVSEYYFCSAKYGYELALFVLPECRGTSAAFRLVDVFQKWCIDQGAIHIDMGVTTGVNEEATGSFYAKLGYFKRGTLYRKVIDHV